MVSFNLIFHLASALLCAVGLWALLHYQSEQRFQRLLWRSLSSGGQGAVLIDWPAKLVLRLAKALDLPLEGQGPQNGPYRVMLAPWVRVHAALGLVCLKWEADKSLTVMVQKEDEQSNWDKVLREALGGQWEVRLAVRGAASTEPHG